MAATGLLLERLQPFPMKGSELIERLWTTVLPSEEEEELARGPLVGEVLFDGCGGCMLAGQKAGGGPRTGSIVKVTEPVETSFLEEASLLESLPLLVPTLAID